MEKTYVFDDSSLANNIEEVFINLDLEVLEKAREELIKDNKSTEIIDKAILEKKRREEIENKKNRKMFGSMFIKSLFSEIFNFNSKPKASNLENWEQDLVNKGEYDEYNFDYEELESDDYYADDDIEK